MIFVPLPPEALEIWEAEEQYDLSLEAHPFPTSRREAE